MYTLLLIGLMCSACGSTDEDMVDNEDTGGLTCPCWTKADLDQYDFNEFTDRGVNSRVTALRDVGPDGTLRARAFLGQSSVTGTIRCELSDADGVITSAESATTTISPLSCRQLLEQRASDLGLTCEGNVCGT